MDFRNYEKYRAMTSLIDTRKINKEKINKTIEVKRKIKE